MIKRSFFVEKDVWNAAKKKAVKSGKTISKLLRELLEEYVKDAE